MNRIRVVSTLAGLVMVAAACNQAPVEPLPLQPELAVAEQSAMSEEIREAMGPECIFLKCTTCPINAPECHQRCIWTGKCATRCPGVEACNPGYVWNERACRCLPDKH
jgi:hypothetical protein